MVITLPGKKKREILRVNCYSV